MMRLGRKKDKDKEEKDKDKDKKDKKDKKEKKEKRKSLSTKKASSSSSKKRTIKAKIEIHPQAISNLPIDLNNSILFLSWKRGAKKSNRGESKRVQVSNGRCVWGDDQPAIPIQATFVQYKGKFTDKKLQLTLHSQVDKKVGHKISEWELHLCEYAADGTDKSLNLANTGKSSNPSIFTARVLTTWLKIDNKTIVAKAGDDYDLASETDGSDTEGDTSIESDMESDMSDMSDDDDDDDEVDMDDDGKIKFVDKGKGGSKIEMKRGSKIIPAADLKKDEPEKHEKEEKEKEKKEREEKEKKEREEKEKKEREEKEKKEKEERERKEQEEKERLAKEKEDLEKKEKEENEKKAAASAATAAPGLKDSRTMPTAGQETYGLCKALYSWKGEKEGDLSFAAGEIIQITRKNERWWEGTAKSGQKGTFPKNYVAEISESDEAKVSSAASSFTAVPTRPPPGPAPVAGPAGLPPPPAFSRPGFAPRTAPVATTPLTSPPASLVTPAIPTPAPSTPTPAPAPAPATPSPPVSRVVSPPYSPPGRVAPPVPSQGDKEKEAREERERKEKEDREKREREEQEKARKLKEEQEKEKEKRDKEEREKKEKEEKERKDREEKERKEREERESTRKGRLEGARAMFERGSTAPAPAVDHAKAAEERKAKIFQTGSLGARIESLGSKKSDTQPAPAASTTAALGSRTSHGSEEPKGTNASGQPPAKANGAVVDSAAAAEQERKLHELQRKLDEASADNKKLKSEKEERVRELEGKTKELERMLADKNQEIWNLREDKTAAAASKEVGEQLGKLRAEADAERKGWQKKVEDMERDAAKLREEKDRAVAQLKEEKDRELARMREEKDREIARLREEKAAAEKRLVGDGEASTGKTQELQRMLADKNQEIWDLREALEKREKEAAQAAAKSERDWKDRSERDAREAKAAGDRAQELSKRSGEQADELARLRSALESKDRELSELREKSRAPSPTASPRMPAINPAEFELQRKQLEALRQQVAKAREDNNALSQKLNDKDREIREEKRVSESLREDIQRAERDKADLRAAADRERTERERRERDLRSREGSENSEMAGLRTEINRVLEEKRGLTITLDGQRGEINKLQDELRARQKKIDDLKEEVDDLKEEIRDKDEEMDKLRGELDERVREAERLKGHVEEHSDKVEKLREELTIKTGELIERERADKTEVGKENLLQQKTTKLEKMVRDMHVELNVKKQSLKKAIKQSEQKEMEIRRLKDKVENLKRQLDEMESGKKDSESDSESESEDEDSDKKKKKKSKKSKKSKDEDDDDDDDDDDKDDGKNLKKTLKKLEIKKDVLKQRLEKLDMVEKTILAVEVRRKDEGRGSADRDDSDDEREPGDGGDAIEVAQDLFWFLEKNGLFDKDHTDQHLLNHVIDALDATLERCVGNTEHQAYYLSLVSTLIQSIILDKEKMEPFRVDEDLVEACAAMREDGIGVIDERRARELEQKQKRAAMKANNSAEVDIDRRPASMGSGGGGGGEGGGRGRGGPPPDMSGGGRGRGGYPPDGRGRGGPAYDSPNRGRGGPPGRGGRGEFAGGPPPGAGPGRGRGGPPTWDSPGGRGGGPDYGPMGDSGGRGRGAPPGWDEPRRPSEGGGRGRGGPPAFSPNVSDDEEDRGARARDEAPVAPPPKKPKRVELRRSATGESLLSSFLRRLYFVAERIFLEMHARVVDTVAPLLIPAILSHPNPGSSVAPPKPGGPRMQHLPSPAEMSGGGSDRLPPTEQDITHHLDVVFTQLNSHSVFPAVMQQFASMVFYSLNVVLLNVVLKRPELCTCSNGFKMKWGLARLTSWLYKSDSDSFAFPHPDEIEDQLQHITEAATLLVMDKAVFAKPQAVRRQFVDLSGPQLRALLFNFRPDAMAPEKVAEEWKKTAAMMASHEGGPLLLADPLLGPPRTHPTISRGDPFPNLG